MAAASVRSPNDGFLVAIVFFATIMFESGAVRYVAFSAFAVYGLAAYYRGAGSDDEHEA